MLHLKDILRNFCKALSISSLVELLEIRAVSVLWTQLQPPRGEPTGKKCMSIKWFIRLPLPILLPATRYNSIPNAAFGIFDRNAIREDIFLPQDSVVTYVAKYRLSLFPANPDPFPI